ncbi:MAG: FGGY-family carbohydrate kinase [Microcoleaceae cyanobacterium]
MNFYLGFDFGTSGVRAIIIDENSAIVYESNYHFEPDKNSIADPFVWQTALFSLLDKIPLDLRVNIRAIALDGTSSTVLFCDATGKPLDRAKARAEGDRAILYNDDRGIEVIDIIKEIAPPHHTVLSATSSLAKLLWWLKSVQTTEFSESIASDKSRVDLKKPEVCLTPIYFLHQADWLGFLLHGKLGISDYHNALKLGYDVENLCYPDWLIQGILPFSADIDLKLPQVVAPGNAIGPLTQEIRDRFHLSSDCIVCAGTTDSIAAFLASGATIPGEAVSSLGSTLAIKLLSHTRVEDSRYGIYSHRITPPLPREGEILWLVGGASNTGGAVLRQYFTDAELEELSKKINPAQESLLDYYPLVKKGDRFPINDPNLEPKLEPRPQNNVHFLQGILESIARIEAKGYQLLQQLGATGLTKVYSAGGGAKNPQWMSIRERYLKVKVTRSCYTEAALGTALLAQRNVKN